MERFIELTQRSTVPQKVLLNLRHIRSVAADEEGCAVVSSEGTIFFVEESYHDVKRGIGAQRQ